MDWLIILALVVVAGVLLLIGIGREALRTLKRIEARMVLNNPLKEEKKVFDSTSGYIVRSDVEDRAIHPDVWWKLYYDEIKDLKGEELSKAKRIWRSRERKRGA